MNLISSNSTGVYFHNTNGSSGPYPTGNVVIGNLLGTDPTGTTLFADTQQDQFVGVQLSSTRDTIIGGPTAAERNIISGNGSLGIDINTGVGDTLAGNYIGLDVSGTFVIGNGAPAAGGGGPVTASAHNHEA